MATEHSNANIVCLGLPSIQPFNPSGDPSNLSQRWCKWKKSLEYFLLASGINDEKRKRALLLHLIGADTQEIFETFSNTGEDYKSAMVKLDEYFDHKKNVPFERHKFREAEQESGESVVSRQFGTEVENNIRDKLVSKCQSTNLRRRLLIEKDLTLQSALEIARLIESADRQTKGIENSSTANKNDETVNAVRKGKKKYWQQTNQFNLNNASNSQAVKQNQGKTCYRCGTVGHVSRDCRIAKYKTCHKYGNLGHLAKMCRTKNPGLKQKVHGFNQFSVEEENEREDDKHPDDDQNDSEHPEYVWTLKNEKLNSFSVKINGQSVKVLIDSGASVNLLDKQTYDNLIPRAALKKTSVKIYPYGSEKHLNILGMFHSKLSGSGEDRTPVTAKLYVTEGSSGSLIGQNTAIEIGSLHIGPEPSLVNKVNKLKVDNDKLSALPKSVQQILSNNAKVFDEIGKLKDFEVKLKVDPSVTPVSQRLRRLPYHTRKRWRMN